MKYRLKEIRRKTVRPVLAMILALMLGCSITTPSIASASAPSTQQTTVSVSASNAAAPTVQASVTSTIRACWRSYQFFGGRDHQSVSYNLYLYEDHGTGLDVYRAEATVISHNFDSGAPYEVLRNQINVLNLGYGDRVLETSGAPINYGEPRVDAMTGHWPSVVAYPSALRVRLHGSTRWSDGKVVNWQTGLLVWGQTNC